MLVNIVGLGVCTKVYNALEIYTLDQGHLGIYSLYRLTYSPYVTAKLLPEFCPSKENILLLTTSVYLWISV